MVHYSLYLFSDEYMQMASPHTRSWEFKPLWISIMSLDKKINRLSLRKNENYGHDRLQCVDFNICSWTDGIDLTRYSKHCEHDINAIGALNITINYH